MVTEKELLDMELHQEIFINGVGIQRVLNGWIYRDYNDVGDALVATFVPEFPEGKHFKLTVEEK